MYRKNIAGQFLCVQLVLTASGAPATACAPAARRCIDGLFGAGGGTFTEDGSTGSYKYAMATADTNGNDISIIVTGTGAIPVCINFVTTAADPTNAATFGITDIDAAISSRMATYTQPTGFLAATFPSGTVANQTNITAGTITTVTNLTNAPTAGDLTATMKASLATAVWTDTTAGDFTVALSVGKSVMNGVSLGTGLTVATVTGQLTAAQIATGVWQDAVAGDFTTASSIGKVLYVGNIVPGAAGGLFIAGSNAATTVNITGNLSGSVGSVTGAVGSVTGAVGSVTGAVGSVTGNVSGSVASVVGAVGSVTGAVGSVTGAVGSVTGNVGGSVASVVARVTANTDQVAGNATAATNVTGAMQAICRGTCSGGTVITAVVSSMTSPSSLTATGQLIGRTILFDSTTATASLQGQASNIISSTTGATPTITFAAMTTAPGNTDTFSIV